MKELEHINDVFSCRSVFTKILSGNKKISTYFLVLDNISDLGKTMFKESRIKEKNGKFTDKSLIIDEIYAQQNKLSLGDEVTWQITSSDSVTLVVDAICYENELDEYRAAVFYLGEQKAIIDRIKGGEPLDVSSAYIDSSDKKATDEYLRSYKPLGMLKSPEDFELYSEYEAYLKSFNEEDYYPQIIKAENYEKANSSSANEYKSIARKSLITFLLLSFIASIAISFTVMLVGGLYGSTVHEMKKGTGFTAKLVFIRLVLFSLICVAGVAGTSILVCLRDGTGVIIAAATLSSLGIIINTIVWLMRIRRAAVVKK